MNTNESGQDWNPGLYLRFRDERTRPAFDLVARIRLEPAPATILDIGCGPGNSSEVLIGRWPNAHLVGIDNSAAMIERAKADHPDREWVLADAREFETDRRFDLVFSNATIQWIPHHKRFIAKLAEMISERGAIAIQIPLFSEMAAGAAVRSVSKKKRWAKSTVGCSDLFTYHDAGYYYDLLAAHVTAIDMWQTDYHHVMASHGAILEWISSTGLRPYLDRIRDADDKAAFERNVLAELEKRYPVRKDGRVLFPFRRLFFIGYKGVC